MRARLADAGGGRGRAAEVAARAAEAVELGPRGTAPPLRSPCRAGARAEEDERTTRLAQVSSRARRSPRRAALEAAQQARDEALAADGAEARAEAAKAEARAATEEERSA